MVLNHPSPSLPAPHSSHRRHRGGCRMLMPRRGGGICAGQALVVLGKRRCPSEGLSWGAGDLVPPRVTFYYPSNQRDPALDGGAAALTSPQHHQHHPSPDTGCPWGAVPTSSPLQPHNLPVPEQRAVCIGPIETKQNPALPAPCWSRCWELEEDASVRGLCCFALWFCSEAAGQHRARGLILSVQDPACSW